ncbi:TetR/AcrR family transcriptional regulator [Actinomadura bangladeshensis]|nr:TetR/AcrR family transcriptional regulator [Actinomadura bangladeshensis]
MSRPRSFDRGAALEQALMTFWRHGYEATSISMLTKAMGINAPSLYGAFGDKHRVFTEAVGRYAETYGSFSTRALAEEPTARASIERLLREAAREYTDPALPPGCMIISAATNCSSAEVKRELRDRREASKRAFRDRIAADRQTGALPGTADPAAMAAFYAATLQGMSVQAADGASREELDRIVDLAMAAWPT